jgi:hypothetical protein
MLSTPFSTASGGRAWPFEAGGAGRGQIFLIGGNQRGLLAADGGGNGEQGGILFGGRGCRPGGARQPGLAADGLHVFLDVHDDPGAKEHYSQTNYKELLEAGKLLIRIQTGLSAEDKMAEKLILPNEVKVCATCSYWDGERLVTGNWKSPHCKTVRHVCVCLWEDLEPDQEPVQEQDQVDKKAPA